MTCIKASSLPMQINDQLTELNLKCLFNKKHVTSIVISIVNNTANSCLFLIWLAFGLSSSSEYCKWLNKCLANWNTSCILKIGEARGIKTWGLGWKVFYRRHEFMRVFSLNEAFSFLNVISSFVYLLLLKLKTFTFSL